MDAQGMVQTGLQPRALGRWGWRTRLACRRNLGLTNPARTAAGYPPQRPCPPAI